MFSCAVLDSIARLKPEVFCTLVVLHVAALRPLDCHWAQFYQELQEVDWHHPDLSKQNNHHKSGTPLNDLTISAVYIYIICICNPCWPDRHLPVRYRERVVIHIEPANLYDSWIFMIYCNSSLNIYKYLFFFTSGRFPNLYIYFLIKNSRRWCGRGWCTLGRGALRLVPCLEWSASQWRVDTRFTCRQGQSWMDKWMAKMAGWWNRFSSFICFMAFFRVVSWKFWTVINMVLKGWWVW